MIQRQRISFQPLEVSDFDQASSSTHSMMYQHTFLKGVFNDSQDKPELNGNLLSPTDINILGRRFTSPETVCLSIWDQLEPSSSMPPANLGSHEQIKPGSGSAAISSTNNGASGPSIRESVSEANNWFSFVSEYAGLYDGYGNNGVPPSQFFCLNDLCPNSFSNAEPIGISNQVLEPGFSEGQHNRGLLQRTNVSLAESPSRTFENSFSVIDFFSNDDGRRQRVKLGDANSSCKRKNVDVVCGESSPVISSTTFSDGSNNTKEDINTRSTTARIVSSEDWSLVSSVGNEESSKRNTRRKITHADQTATSTPNRYLEEDSFALYNPWPAVEISFMDVPSNPAVHSRLTGRNATPNRQHLAHAIPGSTLDLYPHFQLLGSSTSEVGSSSQSPMPSIDEATEELNLVSGTLDQEAVHESLNLTDSVHRDGSMSFDLHHDHPSTLVENVHHQSGSVNCHYPSSFSITFNMLPKQNGGVSGVPLATWSHAATRREGRSRTLEGPLIFDRARNSHDRYQDMRMDIDNMSYEELLALGERIGNVNTGLGEEKILSGLRQRKYIPSLLEPSEDTEHCSICQEEYVEGEELGRLYCCHDFHTICIKQWLGIKNWCPICKNTGLHGA